MVVVLLYPPAQLIGETADLETVGEPGNLELAYVAAARGQDDRVHFPQFGILSYSQDRFERIVLQVRGLGPYALRGDSWAAWREPTSDELRAWDNHKAAVAGILTPDAPGAKHGAPC